MLHIVVRLQIPGYPDRMHREGSKSWGKMLQLFLVMNTLLAAAA